MQNLLLETEFVKALTASMHPNENWSQMYANHETQLSMVVNSQLTTIEKIRHLDHLIADLTAIRGCGAEKKNSIPFIQQLGESLISHIHQYFE